MLRNYNLFFLIGICLFLPSCFKYTESIHLRKDGSGYAHFHIEFTGFVNPEIQQKAVSLIKHLQQLNDTHDAELKCYLINNNLYVSVEFENLEDLNLIYDKGIHLLSTDWETHLPTNHFYADNKMFIRFFNDYLVNKMDKNAHLSDKLQSFSSFYSFDNEIVRVENPFSVISEELDVVKLEFLDFESEASAHRLSNLIFLK
ncbi:MAG: hypothetical protein P8P48_12705 [Saprospiraceae bacterium]|nr:hypothetical protein [Saprospiraceae bacterium]